MVRSAQIHAASALVAAAAASGMVVAVVSVVVAEGPSPNPAFDRDLDRP